MTARGHGRGAGTFLAMPDGRVDLVVSDVGMPELGGGALREILAKTHAELVPILLSTAAKLTRRGGARGSG